MSIPTTLKPGQLWRNVINNPLLIVKHHKDLAAVNLGGDELEPFVVTGLDKTPHPGWTYVGMLTDKGE